MERHEIILSTQQRTINNVKGDINKLKDDDTYEQKRSTVQEIIITCARNMFNRRTSSHKEFLDKLYKYYQKSQQCQKQTHHSEINKLEQMIYIFDSGLEGHASRWWQMVKDNVDNFTQSYYFLKNIAAEKFRKE